MFFHVPFTQCEMGLSQVLLTQVVLTAILLSEWHQNSLVLNMSAHIPQ